VSEDWQEWRETNRASWDERVPIHVGGEFYDVAGFKAGEEHLRPFELKEMGDVSGKELLHLQCHFGKDTLSWARRLLGPRRRSGQGARRRDRGRGRVRPLRRLRG